MQALTPKTLIDMYHALLAISFILTLGFAWGHASENRHNSSYSFKDMIYGMCAGHHHKDEAELKEICDQFSEHFDDLLALQSSPPESSAERYITGLTGLVTLSDTLTKDQKHSFYRRSYEQALEAGENGVEWKWLLGLLVERTNALSLSELQDLMRNTKHEPMKPLIEKAISRVQRGSGIRSGSFEKEESKRGELENEVEENRASSQEKPSNLLLVITGVLIVGILALLLKTFKRKSML